LFGQIAPFFNRMTQRKPAKTNSIDPVKVCVLALRKIKFAADFHRIGNANSQEVVNAAWSQLTSDEQQQITQLVNANTPADSKTIADELIACGSLLEFKALKSQHGDEAVRQAWQELKLSHPAEINRIKAICENSATYLQPTPQSQPEPEPQPTPKPAAELQPSLKKPTLIDLTAELKQLDNLLDTIDGDTIPVELQQAVDELLDQREQNQSELLEKLDNYAALIQSRAYWAATRKAELERLSKLIESDQKTIDFLKGRLKAHLEATDQKKVRTKRFNISVRTVGGKQGVRLNLENPKDLPERFQRVIIEPDNTALREALEADDTEAKEVAYFAERTTYIAIN